MVLLVFLNDGLLLLFCCVFVFFGLGALLTSAVRRCAEEEEVE